jgi:Cytidylyltransferase-like
MSVGYLAGAFDLFNVRDLDLITQAQSHCSRLVVGVFTDAYAEQIIGRRPVVPLVERIALLRHVRGVADVVSHDESSLVGDEWVVFSANDVPTQQANGSVVLIPRRHTESPILRQALIPLDREAVR